MNVSGNRIVFFVLVFLLTASSIGEAAVTLRWRTCCRQEDRVEMFQRWARACEEENPDIIIDWYDPPGGITQVKVEIAGGVGPDVMMQGAGIYSMLDVLMPLSPIVQKYPELRREVIPSVLDQFTWQGEIIYATPHLADRGRGGRARGVCHRQALDVDVAFGPQTGAVFAVGGEGQRGRGLCASAPSPNGSFLPAHRFVCALNERSEVATMTGKERRMRVRPLLSYIDSDGSLRQITSADEWASAATVGKRPWFTLGEALI